MAASPEAILHLAALHTLSQAGFASTSRAASVTLSGVLARYLTLVATTCSEHATLAGRSKVAAVDVVNALEDLGVGGVAELQEWTADLDKQVTFTGGKTDELADYLRDGLSITEGIEARFVPVDSDQEDEYEEDEDEDDEDEGEDDSMDEDAMDVDPKPVRYSLKSPDMSWLPPLPDDQAGANLSGAGAVALAETNAAPQSVAERYRRPVAYAKSQLAEVHQFVDPPHPASPPLLPESSASFPSLLKTYAAIAAEPSTALPQTNGRKQAAELLRFAVANPDVFSPKDTLSEALPPPHISPIVPSHSDTMPTRLLPVNPNQSGIVTSLLHQMRSPFLPAPLRDRLTSLRPPQAQTNDQGAILYGEAVRGPDEASLAKARGKSGGEETEAWFRATWDSGPHGIDKWGRGRLPTGRKVIKAVDGAGAPRTKPSDRPTLGVDTQPARRGSSPIVPVSAGGTGIKLRLGALGAAKTPIDSSPQKSKSKTRSISRSVSPVKQEGMVLD